MPPSPSARYWSLPWVRWLSGLTSGVALAIAVSLLISTRQQARNNNTAIQ